jgi:hypothetical protein
MVDSVSKQKRVRGCYQTRVSKLGGGECEAEPEGPAVDCENEDRV